jgi:hypothetical protein
VGLRFVLLVALKNLNKSNAPEKSDQISGSRWRHTFLAVSKVRSQSIRRFFSLGGFFTSIVSCLTAAFRTRNVNPGAPLKTADSVSSRSLGERLTLLTAASLI